MDRKIILVTNVEETDGGDFKVTVENVLKNHQVDYNIFIIGIGQNEAFAEKCKLLSESTNGGYVNLETANYDTEKLSNILRTLSFKIISSSITNFEESNQKLCSALNNIVNANKEFQKNNNEEIVKIMIRQSRSIELINK